MVPAFFCVEECLAFAKICSNSGQEWMTSSENPCWERQRNIYIITFLKGKKQEF